MIVLDPVPYPIDHIARRGAAQDVALIDKAGSMTFAELEAACDAFTAKVNSRRHRESARVPAEALAEERARLHVLPAAPHTMALGTTRIVNSDHTIRFGSVRYSTPPGLVGSEVWVWAAGSELVVVADLDALPVAEQMRLLEATLKDDGSAAKEITTMLDAWNRGDAKAVAKAIQASDKDSPQLYKIMFTERNAKWAQWVDQRLARLLRVVVRAMAAGSV